MNLNDWIGLITFYIGYFMVNGPKFKAHFGLSISTLRNIWEYIAVYKEMKPKYLIFTIYFLKTNPTWYVCSTFCKCHIKTARKWIYSTIDRMNEKIPVKHSS